MKESDGRNFKESVGGRERLSKRQRDQKKRFRKYLEHLEKLSWTALFFSL